MRRRHFLQLAAGAVAGAIVEHASPASASEISLRIAPLSGQLAPGVTVKTAGCHRRHDTVTVTDADALGASGWISRDEVIHVLLEKQPQEPWSHPEMEFPRLQPGRRYRLRIMNATASDIAVHLPGDRVELTRVDQSPISGIITDTIRLQRYSVVDADLIVGV